MSTAERSRAFRQRQAVKRVVERHQRVSAAAEVIAKEVGVAPVLPALPSIFAAGPAAAQAREPAPAPPELPADQPSRLARIEDEVISACRGVLADPSSPAQAKIAAARTLAELTGLMRLRTAPPDPAKAVDPSRVDPDELMRQAAATRKVATEMRETLTAYAAMMER